MTPPRPWPLRTLAHPAFLLVLTAALTGLLAPWITSRWEARSKQVEARRLATQRELDVKSTIVSRIGTSSADFLSAVELGVIDAGGTDAQNQERALKQAAFEIGSQLAAYFPGSLPENDWRDYTYSLRNAYILLTSRVGKPRSLWLDRLDRYLDRTANQYNGLCSSSRQPVFQTGLRKLVLAFQNKEEAVVKDVAASPTVLTGTPTPDHSIKLLHYDRRQNRPCG